MATSVRPAKQTVEELTAWIQELERRIEALERRSEAPSNVVETSPALSAAESTFSVTGGAFASLGRALLVFAGAYLLRAGWESGVLPQKLGIAVGLAYALFWLAWPAKVRLPYGVTAALIFAAMLWENTVRAQVIPPIISAPLVMVFALTGLVLATPIPMLASLAFAVLLIFATRAVIPFTVAVLVVAAATEFIVCRKGPVAVRWIVALSANCAVLALTFVATHGSMPLAAALGLPLALLSIYAASATYRTLIQKLDLEWLEAGEIATAFVMFAIGGLMLARTAVAGFCLLCGAVCYSLAIVFARRGSERNLYVYATFGLAVVLTGLWAFLSGLPLTSACCVMALLTTYFAVFELQAPVYLLAATLASGLLMFGGQQMIGLPETGAGTQRAMILAIVTMAVCYGIARTRIPAVGALALLCWGLLGFGAAAVPQRVALISALALVLAYAGVHWRRQECVWLVYPVMLLGAFRLLFFDFQSGHPAAVALSLVFYGGALWLLPRQLRRA